MKRNFSVGQSNELILQGQVFDLHNWYDFSGLVILTRRQAQLWFTPSAQNDSHANILVIDIQGVDVLEATPSVLQGNTHDVDEVGYKNPEDFDLDWLLPERNATPADHLLFRLGPSDYIRIHGEQAQLQFREDDLALLTTRPHSSPPEGG